LCTRIRELRIEKGITQKKLAELLNISQQAVANYEKGKRVPKKDLQEKLAGIFNMPASYVMGVGFSPKELEEITYEAIYYSLKNIIENNESSGFDGRLQRWLRRSVLLDALNLRDVVVKNNKILPYEEVEESLKNKLNKYFSGFYFMNASTKIAGEYAFYNVTDYSEIAGIQYSIKRDYINRNLPDTITQINSEITKEKEKELLNKLNLDNLNIFDGLSINNRELKRALLTGKTEKARDLINQNISILNDLKGRL